MAGSTSEAVPTCVIAPSAESSRSATAGDGAARDGTAAVGTAQPGDRSRISTAFRARHSRLNLAVDVSLVSFLVLVDGLGNVPDRSALPALLLLTLLVAAAWVITGSALGYYDAPANGRKPLDDAALAATMVLGMMFLAAAFNLATPLSPPFRRILLLCWPLAILVRIAFFRPPTSQERGVPFALPAYTFRLQRARPVPNKAVADGYLHYAVVDSSAPQRAVKRICDLLIASAALWLLAPLFVVV